MAEPLFYRNAEFMKLNELILRISEVCTARGIAVPQGCWAGLLLGVWLCIPWTAEVLQTQLFIPKWEFSSNYLRLVTPENHFAQWFCHGDKQNRHLVCLDFFLVVFIIIITVEYFLLLFPLQCCSNILERHLEGLNPLWILLKTHPAVF